MLGIDEIAEPVGVVAGVTPVTNPTSTAIFKSLIALKTRCPIIFGFHPGAQNCSVAMPLSQQALLRTVFSGSSIRPSRPLAP